MSLIVSVYPASFTKKISLAGVPGLNDLVFVVDSSEDVSKDNLAKVISFIQAFTSSYKFNGDTLLSVVNYGEKTVTPLLPQAGGKQIIVDYVLDFLKPVGGKRDLNKAIQSLDTLLTTKSYGIRDGVKKTVVWFVHGENKESVDEKIIKELRDRKDVSITVVAIGKKVNSIDIGTLSPDANVITLNDTTELPSAYPTLEDIILSGSSK